MKRVLHLKSRSVYMLVLFVSNGSVGWLVLSSLSQTLKTCVKYTPLLTPFDRQLIYRWYLYQLHWKIITNTRTNLRPRMFWTKMFHPTKAGVNKGDLFSLHIFLDCKYYTTICLISVLGMFVSVSNFFARGKPMKTTAVVSISLSGVVLWSVAVGSWLNKHVNLLGVPTWKLITCPLQCGMKLLIHSQTSTVAPLKFWNG